MQNVEKTIQGILKKFEVKDDYEKRKVVFWYDKDRTVEDDEELEQIKSSLFEKDINLHILNNNFFETKKLLEKDDTESHYLIYSPEAERDAHLRLASTVLAQAIERYREKHQGPILKRTNELFAHLTLNFGRKKGSILSGNFQAWKHI